MLKPLLTVLLGKEPYDQSGAAAKVSVAFRETDGTGMVTTEVYKNWMLVSCHPTSSEEALRALETLIEMPVDKNQVVGWNVLSRSDQYKAMAVLRMAIEDPSVLA